MKNLVPGSPGFVERLLADRIGLDVASVGEGLIAKGVEDRMSRLGVRRLEDYERILLGPSNEIQALIEEVVIPESWFFRDDRPFATFRDFVRVGWVADKHRPPISILCLPCAGGEEPYSIVIALLELGIERDRFEVVAIDISERSIQRATAGIYGVNAFRGIDPKLQNQYFDFTSVRGRYQLKSSVKSAVRFEVGNILDPSLLVSHRDFDVVFCRNLLIYFDEPARIKAFANLDRLTATDGLLFLGHADRADPTASTRFAPIRDKGSFGYQKQKPVSLIKVAPTSSSGSISTKDARLSKPKVLVPKPSAVPRRSSDSDRLADPSRLEVPFESNNPLSVGLVRTDCDEALNQALILAGEGRYDEATRLVRSHLGRGTLDASAHFLLGIIHQAEGDRAKAEAELIKAIYLNPEHDEALLALALLARRKGDMAAEAVFRRRADRVLARKGRP